MSTHNIHVPFSIENHPKLTQICSYWIFFPKGHKPLKFYCIFLKPEVLIYTTNHTIKIKKTGPPKIFTVT